MTLRLAVIGLLLWFVAGQAATAQSPQEKGFEAAQWAMVSSAGKAVQQLGLRAAANSPQLAGLVRRRQDLVALAADHERRLPDAAPGEQIRLRGVIDSVTSEIGSIDREIAAAFPRYASLADPKPVSIADVQADLEEDEALLLIFAGGSYGYTWAISKRSTAWHRSYQNQALVTGDVRDIRAELDPNAPSRGGRSLNPAATDRPTVKPFDRVRAWLLYMEMIQPVEHVLDGVRHVFVVTDGALSGLPLSLLVTSNPEGRDDDPAALRDTDWLIKRYAITTLPSVASLGVLRRFPVDPAASERVAFRGFGAPVLGGRRAVASAASGGTFFRGALADVGAVRDLAPLPQTGPELRRLAATLRAGSDAVFLGPQATEAIVKRADLSTTKVLAFATHGLLSGELTGLAEPALVLTPPEVASPLDDGLLTASEIAALRLSADWVILSACNTAASDGTPDADGLSGLARSFIYAGARAILVSHWPVRDDAASRLTTGALGRFASIPGTRRAEALRQSIIELMMDKGDPTFSHPSAWAPFVIVGEGGR